MSGTKIKNQCEGWTRNGGAFTLGPVSWKQCENQGVFRIKFKDGEAIQTLPACQKCLDECRRTGVKIIEIKNL